MLRLWPIGALGWSVLASCGAATEEPPGPPTTGWVAVSTATAGEHLSGQKVVQLGAASRLLGSNDLVVFDSVTPGTHTVRLIDGGPNFCQLIGNAEQTVTVAAADTSYVNFELQCPIVGAERLLLFIDGAIYSITEFATRMKLIVPGANGQNYHAHLSPDGKRIAFTSQRDGNQEIYLVNADGTNLVNLTASPGTRDWWPRWSPDGKRIIFYSWVTEIGPSSGEIYVLDPDNSVAWQQLTFNDALDADPEWSPDGTRIVFMREQGGDQEILVMNADGSGETALTNSPGLDGTPAWSPDGKRIAFATSRFGAADSYDIVVMNADGSGLVRLTDDPEIDVRPIWSPDGKRIMYTHRVSRGNIDVWLMNADGSEARPVYAGAGNEQGEDWGVPATSAAVKLLRGKGVATSRDRPAPDRLSRLTKR